MKNKNGPAILVKLTLIILIGLIPIACSKTETDKNKENAEFKKFYKDLPSSSKEQLKQFDAQMREQGIGHIRAFDDPSLKTKADYAKITAENFKKIKMRMGIDEVKKIMGSPTSIRGDEYIWGTKDDRVEFQVKIENGKVAWTTTVNYK